MSGESIRFERGRARGLSRFLRAPSERFPVPLGAVAYSADTLTVTLCAAAGCGLTAP
jgi:hypothetical protein